MKASSTKKDATPDKTQRDEVGRSGVYPVSGPLPDKDAPVRGQMEWGQGERGAVGYEDHGSSELSYQGGALLGGLDEEWASFFGNNNQEASEGREVPLEVWTLFCDWFGRHYLGITTTITYTDGQPGFPTAARRLPLVKLAARVMENKVAAISVQLDRKPNDFLLNITDVKRMTYFTEANGKPKSLHIEKTDGRVLLLFGEAA